MQQPTQRPFFGSQNPQDLDTTKCNGCGQNVFIQIFVIKKVPEWMSGTGREETFPMPRFVCANPACNLPLGEYPKSEYRAPATNTPQT